MKKNLFKIGDIVRIRRSFLGEPEGIQAYVYESYTIGGDSGVSIITENGVDLGGFSAENDDFFKNYNKSEQELYLTYVKNTGYEYKFKNVIQLNQDFDTLIKPLFII